MKKVLALLMMFLTMATTTVLPTRVSAEGTAKPNMFGASKETAVAALQSGNFTTYQPQYFGLRGKDPVNGTTKVVAPLEGDAVIYLLTTASWQWVVQPKGTMLRWNVNQDGTLTPYALDSCGNPVKEVYYPPPLPVEPPASQPVTPTEPVVAKEKTPPPPPTVTLTATPANGKKKMRPGKECILAWSSTNATSCSAEWTPSTEISGSYPVVLVKGDNTFTITAHGEDGRTATATVCVTAKKGPWGTILLVTAVVATALILRNNIGGGSASKALEHSWGTAHPPTGY